MGDQILAEHLTGARRGLVRGLDHLDAAALAAAAGMNLRFDHAHAAAEFSGRLLRLLGRRGDDAARHDTPKRLRISLA